MKFRNDIPICVDLDGTLIHTDTTITAMGKFARQRYFHAFYFVPWFLRGLAHFKHKLFSNYELQVSSLPFNAKVLAELQKIKHNGNPIYLVTATDAKMARQVADHLSELFDECYASDGRVNLRHKAKGDLLIKLFGKHGYVYFGNSRDDLYVWRYAHTAVVVNASKRLARKAQSISKESYVL
ncbi:MAG: hypothetical protein OYH77_04835 [Pseudomonadota bacterium]|nr:hypothetical protein [Pseudomonadota bacterium]